MKTKSLCNAFLAFSSLGLLLSSFARAESIEILNAGQIPITGGSYCYAKHLDGALEGYKTIEDLTTSEAPSSPYTQSMLIYTSNDGLQLARDVRPPASETVFTGNLVSVNKVGGMVTSSNYLSFAFYSPDVDRVRIFRIHCDGQYTPNAQDFDYIGIVSNGSVIILPGVLNAPNGTVYASWELSCRKTRTRVMDVNLINGEGTFTHTLQPGTFACIEASQDLTTWTPVTPETFVTPTPANFDTFEIRTNTISISSNVFFRVMNR